MKRLLFSVLLVTVGLLPLACTAAAPTTDQKAPSAVSFPAIDGNAVLQHVKVLASDEYEGRAPGTKGEDLTVAYIEDQFSASPDTLLVCGFGAGTEGSPAWLESQLGVQTVPLASRFGQPGELNAGLLGYLEMLKEI